MSEKIGGILDPYNSISNRESIESCIVIYMILNKFKSSSIGSGVGGYCECDTRIALFEKRDCARTTEAIVTFHLGFKLTR